MSAAVITGAIRRLAYGVLLIIAVGPAFAFEPEKVKSDLLALDLSQPFVASPAIAQYLAFYSLDFPNVRHWMGTVEADGQPLVAQVFLPEKPVGTLFLIHGFLDHTGTLAKLIDEALSRGYGVVAWDLPGHGLSSGERTDIGDFYRCARQFARLAGELMPFLPRPYQLVAHSTGASVALEYLFHTDDSAFQEVVLLAPLVRHQHWGLGKFGWSISRPFTDSVPRTERENSNDPAYLEFAHNDPLAERSVSYAYLEDLYTWEKRVQDYPQWPGPLLIVQGEEDDVVQWEYNLEFLQSKLPNAEIATLPGVRHQLINESAVYRQQVFDIVFAWLEGQSRG